VHTERPLPQFSVYTAAKAGIVALTRALALELAPRVRVNAVARGSLDWPETGVFTDDERRAGEAAIPLGRLGTGDDIARAVEFLLFGNDYVTGHVLNVDGGSSLVSHWVAPHLAHPTEHRPKSGPTRHARPLPGLLPHRRAGHGDRLLPRR